MNYWLHITFYLKFGVPQGSNLGYFLSSQSTLHMYITLLNSTAQVDCQGEYWSAPSEIV